MNENLIALESKLDAHLFNSDEEDEKKKKMPSGVKRAIAGTAAVGGLALAGAAGAKGVNALKKSGALARGKVNVKHAANVVKNTVSGAISTPKALIQNPRYRKQKLGFAEKVPELVELEGKLDEVLFSEDGTLVV